MELRRSIKPGTWNIPEKPEHPETWNNYHNYEKKMCKIKFWACSRDYLERSDWSSDIMFLFAGRTTLPQMNAYWRTFHRGKSIEKCMRSLIIDDILSGGRNVSTEYYSGSFRAIGSKYKVIGVTVSNLWKTFCQTGENVPLHAAARGQPKRLTEPEIDLVQLLIKCRRTGALM